MKRKLLIMFALLTFSLTGLENSALAQGPNATQKTSSKMIYHNGPVVTWTPSVYVVWYGCWRSDCGNLGSSSTQFILIDLISNLGSTPYFQINSTYPNGDGQTPNGALVYGGSAVQLTYTHGNELTDADVAGIISDQVLSGGLPLDPSGLYVMFSSSDISATSVGFCSSVGGPPHHGFSTVLGTKFRYGFVGNSSRCPALEAPQFVAADGTLLPTPNGDLAGDAMVSNLAHLLSSMISNPDGSGWYDRYGLENADKCQGTFGTTYTTASGARSNVKLGARDFLIQQNWVNDRKGRCAMSQ